MKKSPFSTPRGNGGRPGFGWNSGGSPGGGYGRPKNNEFFSPNRSQISPQNQSGSDDFIPFNNCTPPPTNNQRNWGGNWQSPRGHWQGNSGGGRGARRPAIPGYNNYRDNKRGRDHYQQAPFYVDTGKPVYGQRKNFQRGRGGSHGKADISRYMNLHSFLEDPWTELTKQLKRFNTSPASTKNNVSADLSFNNVLGSVRLDNSPTNQEAVNAEDSKNESHNSFLQTS